MTRSADVRGLYLDDLEVGRTFTTSRRKVTEADILAFAGLSGDFNALHFDDEFARTEGLGARVAHGPCVYAIATGLIVGTGIFDRTNIAFADLTWSFKAPVFIDDTIHATLTVESTRPSASKPDRGVMTSRVEVVNQDGVVVQGGTWTQIQRRRPTAA